jgi:hypothetical protein
MRVVRQVLESFKKNFKIPVVHMGIDGQWRGEAAAATAADIAAETGLSPDRVREIIQLYLVNYVEQRLFERVARRREELVKTELTDEDLQPVVEEIAAETAAPASWLWGRFPIGGLAGSI